MVAGENATAETKIKKTTEKQIGRKLMVLETLPVPLNFVSI